MRKSIISLSVISILYVGCGGNQTTPTSSTDGVTKKPITTTAKTKVAIIAKNNSMRDVVKPFNGYTIKVLTDKALGEDDLSNDTFAVYGTIDGKRTDALLKLNRNYPKGTQIVMEVLKDDRVVGRSKTMPYEGGNINFGSINIRK